MAIRRRWVLGFAALALVATASVIGARSWIGSEPVPAALTTGLQGRWEVIDGEFQRRVVDRFPIGSPEVDLAMELGREGFSRQDRAVSSADEHKAARREDNFVCKVAAYVTWRADSDGRLTAVGGHYGNEGCL